MAATEYAATTTAAGNPPLAYVVAVWMGMPRDQIIAGLKDGTVAPPPGAPEGWLPPWASDGWIPPPNDERRPIFGDGDSVSIGTPPLPGSPDASTEVDVGAPPDQSTPKVDRDAIRSLLIALDPELTDAEFDIAWEASGPDDATRERTLFEFLCRTLLDPAGGDASPESRSLRDLTALRAYVSDPAHRSSFIDLAELSGADIARLARENPGYRRALSNLDRWALAPVGDAASRDPSHDRFDPDTGEALVSDSWIDDRSRYLAWKLALDGGRDNAVDGASWRFVDREQGENATIELAGSSAGATNQVIFGREGGDVVTGSGATDRIHGASGDDVLRGGAGADLLDGGRGADLLFGGAGADALAGGLGDDEIEGGSGNDRLTGDSGDDSLAGGRGDDRLEGGKGADGYRFDSGDGTDTIVDADGHGSVFVDEVAISGTSRRRDGSWASEDGKIEYSFDGEPDEGGTLTIRVFRGGQEHSSTPENTIRVRNWRNGQLGITLGDGSAAALTLAPDESDAQESVDQNNRLSPIIPPIRREGNEPGMGGDHEGGDSISQGNESGIGNGAPADEGVGSGASDDGAESGATGGEGEADQVPDTLSEADVDAALDEFLALDRIFGIEADPISVDTLARAVASFDSIPGPPDVEVRVDVMQDGGGAGPATVVHASDIADAVADFGEGVEVGEIASPSQPTILRTEGVTEAVVVGGDDRLAARRSGAHG